MQNINRKTEPVFPARNYLTLLVGLIVLICATIGLALALAAPALSGQQKWILVLTLILFPVFSIAVVSWLILRHSGKLAVAGRDGTLRWETTSPERQKRKLNGEVRELARLLEIPPAQMSDLRSAYIVAEDLALRQIQSEADAPLMHKIDIGNAEFDAVFIKDDLVTCVDVTFVVGSDVPKEKIGAYLRKMTAAANYLEAIRPGSRIKLLLVIVTQLDDSPLEKLRANVRAKFTPELTPVATDVRFFDFQGLQKIYADD